MTPSILVNGRGPRGPRRAAFSLPELMIALAILGLGLLFIAAALPAGLSYTRDTIDLATGDAAADYAMGLIETQVRCSREYPPVVGGSYLYNADSPGKLIARTDALVRPRRAATDPPVPPRWEIWPGYEPRVKVRPLVMGNVGFSGTNRGVEHVDDTEELINAWLQLQGLSLNADTWVGEGDWPVTNRFTRNSSRDNDCALALNPIFGSVNRVFPPISRQAPFDLEAFFSGGGSGTFYPKYVSRQLSGVAPIPALNVNSDGISAAERRKAFDSRVSWTAFYHCLDWSADPLTYEFIIVVTRRSAPTDRFAMQVLTGSATANTFQRAQAVVTAPTGNPRGADRLFPTPWLVCFEKLPPALTANVAYADTLTGPDFSRPLLPAYRDPPFLRFEIHASLNGLFPVGSVFIPAVNDDSPNGLNTPPPSPPNPPNRRAGFVPHAPNVAPIYEVVERPNETTVIVKSNGFYPWLASGATALDWPVWVIPPAFSQRQGNQPVFEKHSSIVSVLRKTIRVPETP